MNDQARSIPSTAIQPHLERYGTLDVVRLAVVRQLAAEYGLSVRQVELQLLAARAVPLRYARNIGTIGLAGQTQLLQSTAAVVGLGGLGGYIAEALARMGVGHLVLIDGDVFAEHNLNRQLVSDETVLQRYKVEIARDRLARVNSAVEVTVHATMVSEENLPHMLVGADVIVDGLDCLTTRLLLQRAAHALRIPFVHGSIAGFIGQVLTIMPGDPGLLALYGESDDLPDHGLEAILGTPAATPMLVAAWEAQEAVKVLTGKGQLLRNTLLIIDTETGTIDRLKLA
jgi:molybdopterin/thiamine biosynthesis adenylyltransferase